jgi:hypothetical protein
MLEISGSFEIFVGKSFAEPAGYVTPIGSARGSEPENRAWRTANDFSFSAGATRFAFLAELGDFVLGMV